VSSSMLPRQSPYESVRREGQRKNSYEKKVLTFFCAPD
jgi:hypothetical protein